MHCMSLVCFAFGHVGALPREHTLNTSLVIRKINKVKKYAGKAATHTSKHKHLCKHREKSVSSFCFLRVLQSS